MFPKNSSEHKMKKRWTKKYKTTLPRTKRYKISAIPFMVNLLNEDEKYKLAMMK